MAQVAQMTFNPFQENTYLVYDETGECLIFDPGCSNSSEENALKAKIEALGLTPVRLINTHCHLDHVFGNRFVADTYKLGLEIHEKELAILEAVPMVCDMYGIPKPAPSPAPANFLKEGEYIEFGNTKLLMLFTPGHSPGSITFYCEADQFMIAGDVLFHNSIGRTDLPGGDHQTLINSIKNELLPLGDDIIVYSGHGPKTQIGFERKNNPFL